MKENRSFKLQSASETDKETLNIIKQFEKCYVTSCSLRQSNQYLRYIKKHIPPNNKPEENRNILEVLEGLFHIAIIRYISCFNAGSGHYKLDIKYIQKYIEKNHPNIFQSSYPNEGNIVQMHEMFHEIRNTFISHHDNPNSNKAIATYDEDKGWGVFRVMTRYLASLNLRDLEDLIRASYSWTENKKGKLISEIEDLIKQGKIIKTPFDKQEECNKLPLQDFCDMTD